MMVRQTTVHSQSNCTNMSYQSVAVFCGSKDGNNELYVLHAQQLGADLAKANIALVYGGGNKGLMGATANAVLAHHGKVIGIIPEVLVAWEHAHNELTELHVVNDMHSRKKLMYQLSEAIIILPGGNGTMDELFEVLTWNQLQIHDKKIILLNSAGYYNHLLGHMNHMQLQGFLYENWRDNMVVCETPQDVIDFLTA